MKTENKNISIQVEERLVASTKWPHLSLSWKTHMTHSCNHLPLNNVAITTICLVKPRLRHLMARVHMASLLFCTHTHKNHKFLIFNANYMWRKNKLKLHFVIGWELNHTHVPTSKLYGKVLQKKNHTCLAWQEKRTWAAQTTIKRDKKNNTWLDRPGNI